jgi:hypothetical protein
MNTPRTRVLAVSGATLALIVAGTAVVSAHPGGERGERGQRGERGRSAERFEGRSGGIRGQIRQRIGGQVDDFVRRETMVQTEDGTTVRRVDNGTLDGASATTLDYTLSTGETVSVTIDDDTQAVAFAAPEENAEGEGRRRFRGPRLRPSEVAVSDIEAGSQIIVWTESQDGDSFLAQRVVVRPDVQAEGAESVEATDAASVDVLTLDLPDPVAA